VKINGWQRLWIVAISIWAVVYACLLFYWAAEARVAVADFLPRALAYWFFFVFVFAALIYGVGWIVAWVIRGFRGPA
jgi:hypothetical protein